MHRQTLQLRETVLGKDHPDTLGKDHPDTLASMSNLALSLYQQGKYAEAEVMNRQALQLRETVLGKDHPDTLASIHSLAISLRQQGKHTELEAIHQRADLKSEHPQDRLDTTARKKRKAEHEDNRGPRRSTRIKESQAGS
jgi:hypothetical protein